ncbi:MAG: ATP-dependent 6-phosphofructokinase [Clostridia bacterium]|nr:ATP-dependent 6-phosphofructokinase [Clostridia bacterium]
MKIKKVAVLTSGGDAPGMNSAIYGIFSACRENNINLLGFIGGYDGLIDNNFIEITFDVLDGKINDGGSVIKSSRSPRFLKKTFFNKALKNITANKIDALIIIGGDGTIRGAMELRDAGIKVITLPGTIDNDLNFSYTIGFNTALNNIVNAVDNITDSLSAFNYGGVVKIMGRDCPDLTEAAALALHSEFVVKHKDFNLNELVKQIKKSHDNNHLPPVVLVQEDCVDTNELAKILQEKCKFQFRPHILGYIQRGGKPSAMDRSYAFSVGRLATTYLLSNEHSFTLGLQGDNFVKKPFEDAIKKL